MKIIKYLTIFLALTVTSCMSFTANIKDVSENEQMIEVTIHKITFDGNNPLIKTIILNVKNISNSTIRFIPDNCYFRDNKGFHKLIILPINLRANENINIPIESYDYFKTSSNMFNWGYGMYSVSTNTEMQDLNVSFIEVNFSYLYNNIENIGMFYIDVEKLNKMEDN